MNGNNNQNRNNMTPRERYFAEQRAQAERESRRQAEAAKLAAEREREARLLEQKRIYAAKERRRKEAEKRKRKQKARIFARRALLFSVVFVIILAIVGLCFLVSWLVTKTPEDDTVESKAYTYIFTEDGDELTRWKQAEADSVKNGILYIDFSEFASAVGFTLTGNGDERRFVLGEGAEEMTLTVGTPVISVNNFSYRMDADAVYSAEKSILLPFSFITECVRGIEVTFDEKKPTVTLEITGEISFVIKPADAIPPVSEETDYGDTTEASTDTDTDSTDTEDTPVVAIPEVEFISDLSEYEMYMNPEGEARDAYLILVNYENKLDENYLPDDLTDVINTRKDGRNTQKLRLYAAKALEALFIELYASGYTENGPGGYPVTVMSAYRSFSYQSQLFNQYVDREMQADPSLTREQAEEKTSVYSARPGTSEHQTGLCVDMHNLPSASNPFANEEEYEWLYENAWKFGFVERFPEGKTDITKIKFEPWHYRYVGRYHAYQMKTLGLCLEEYIEYLENNE